MKLPFAPRLGSEAPAGTIEWEELPSLADSLAQRLVVLGTRHRDALGAARARASAFEQIARAAERWESTRAATLESALAPSERGAASLQALTLEGARPSRHLGSVGS